jgi:DME family drug/metabolite transporter
VHPDRRVLLGSLAIVIAAACFSSLGSLSRLSYEAGLTPLGFSAWRAAIGALVVGALVIMRTARGRPLVGLRGQPRRVQTSLLIAVVCGIVVNLAIFVAFSRITVALALFTLYSYPVLVTMAIAIRERQRPDGVQLTALAMAVVGMAVVVLSQLDPATGVRFEPIGLALALLAAAAQTVFILVSRRGYTAIPTDEATLAILVGGALGALVVAVAIGDPGAMTAPFRAPAAWPLLLVAGTVGAGFPSLLYLTAVRWIGGVRTGILAMFEPVVGTILAALLLGELLHPIQVLGGALVLGAGALLQRSRGPGGGAGPREGDLARAPDAVDLEVEPVPLV